MFAQLAIVTVLVIGCTASAAWTLMPVGARRTIARALLKFPLPDRLASALQKQLSTPSGCGCDGCDRGAKPAAAAGVEPIRFHPRPKP